MSYDFKLKHTCMHLVVDEILELDSDRKSLRFERPPSATSPDQIILKINGFEIDRTKDTQYSYDLIRDEEYFVPVVLQFRPNSMHKKKIHFRKILKSQDDLFEVTYRTDEQNCRRCHGLRVEDDIRFDFVTGKLIVVVDQQKLIQHLTKFVFTVLGSNPFHPLVGTNVFALIGEKIISLDLVALRLQQEIINVLQIYLGRQVEQSTLQEVTDAEFLERIRGVLVEPNNIDPSLINVTITATNRTFGEVIISEDITSPGFNQSLFSNAATTYGLTENDANNSQLGTLPPSPVQRFRSSP